MASRPGVESLARGAQVALGEGQILHKGNRGGGIIRERAALGGGRVETVQPLVLERRARCGERAHFEDARSVGVEELRLDGLTRRHQQLHASCAPVVAGDDLAVARFIGEGRRCWYEGDGGGGPSPPPRVVADPHAPVPRSALGTGQREKGGLNNTGAHIVPDGQHRPTGEANGAGSEQTGVPRSDIGV